MKIAISGTHCSGKTTLVEELSRALLTYEVVDEPYFLLEEEGHQFSEMPCLEDFELQLDRSIQCIVRGGRDGLFERCPVDFLANLFAHRDSMRFDIASWLPRVHSAMEQLSLIVFVPLESPDRIRVSGSANAGLRRRVDEQLRRLFTDDPWEFGVRVLEVTGSTRERAERVLGYLHALGP
jgi:AAA domain